MAWAVIVWKCWPDKLANAPSRAAPCHIDRMQNIDPLPSPTIWFVSRHPGAREWMARQNLHFDRHVSHLEPGAVMQADTVIGTLPVNLAAEICTRGAKYLHLSLKLPTHARGRELDADELEQLGARLVPYHVGPLP